jgi:hypothetical protein
LSYTANMFIFIILYDFCLLLHNWLNRSSLHGSLYRLPVTMENVCCHRNMLTEPFASNGLVRCSGNLYLASPSLAMNFRSVLCCGNLYLASPLLAMNFRSVLCCGNLYLASRRVAMDFRYGSAIPAFGRYITVIMQVSINCQVLSEQTSDSCFLNVMCLFNACTQLWTAFFIFYINCYRISDCLL